MIIDEKNPSIVLLLLSCFFSSKKVLWFCELTVNKSGIFNSILYLKSHSFFVYLHVKKNSRKSIFNILIYRDIKDDSGAVRLQKKSIENYTFLKKLTGYFFILF
ncbi:MAG: hypothetical protein A2W99_07170 [Bacteroidetes bacterium GWF2_33_16]|nr:MAG: hypothetical protein A2X00_11950 [Bacteroidetes bacterium GWE2_32_14]OFY03173.1 MAG: hypothetical protein A2W99_07170 [Bacteroidetes bacterium GWF2_33_16]